MFNLWLMLCVSILLSAMSQVSANDVSTSEIRDNLVSVAQDSKNLAYSLGSLFQTVGSEVVKHTKNLGHSISEYIESFQQPTVGVPQIVIYEDSEQVSVVVKKLENIDIATCRHAKVQVLESFPVQVEARIEVNSNTTIKLRGEHTNLSVTIMVTAQEVGKEQNDTNILYVSSLKEQKIAKAITTKNPINLEDLKINIDTAAEEMIIVIPYVSKIEKLLPVSIK